MVLAFMHISTHLFDTFLQFHIVKGANSGYTLYRSYWRSDVTSVLNLSKTSFIGKIRSVHIIYGTSSRNKGVNITGNTRPAFLSVELRKGKILMHGHLRCITRVHPSSFPLSWIKGCTPLHDRCLPPSLIVGVKVRMLVVIFLSGLVWKIKMIKIWKRNNTRMFCLYTVRYRYFYWNKDTHVWLLLL